MRSLEEGHASPLCGVRTLAALAGVVLLAGGCGSSHHPVKAARPRPPSVCRPEGRVAVAGMLGVSQGIVRSVATVGNNSFPECHFVVASGRRVSVVVNVDNSPQPYFRLERTIVEDGQQFGVQRTFSPPQAVPRLGLDASWIPDQHLLITTDGTDLISVTISWSGAKAGQRVALAKVAARAYLGKLRPKNANGYASG